jgi:phytoene/squalene synthetase
MKIDGVERTAAAEAVRLVRKDRSKLKLTLGLYALTLKGREIGKLSRASYFFARHLDDVLDGELDITDDPVDYARSLQGQVKSGQFDASSRIARLVRYSLPILESKAIPEDNPRAEFSGLIDALIYDHDRRITRRTLRSEELEQYYGNVINPGINVLMMGFGSKLRSQDIPGYAPSLGRLYSVRDLEKDWDLGIINIPSAELTQAGLTSHADYSLVSSSAAVRSWAINEVQDAGQELREIQQGLADIVEPLPRMILDGLAKQALAVTA